ncbi:MAG TPA: hypothetical protein VEC06_18355 [Paucimonas sp.]|nr:hypothetical protein [Paucimonas sp.]
MRIRHLFAVLVFAAVLPALAFDRPFPKDIKRGRMTPAAHPSIVIDGKPRALSIGARIWNENNLIEQPAALRGENIVVNYTENGHGEIDRVWILTPEEASRSVQAQRQQGTQ